MMPPASFDGSWYGVARVHFKEAAEVRVKSGVAIGLICKEQLIDAVEEDSIRCWEYNGVEFRAGKDTDDLVKFLERRIAETQRDATPVY